MSLSAEMYRFPEWNELADGENDLVDGKWMRVHRGKEGRKDGRRNERKDEREDERKRGCTRHKATFGHMV